MKIVVDCDGEVVSFEDGVLKSPKEFHERARRNLILQERVRLLQPRGEFVKVGTKTPLEVMALLYSLTPGRTTLLEGPEECWNVFKESEDNESEENV